VDTRTSDDAGVFRLSDEIALVQTVDFFTPVVDDPYTWGSIAAANSLSDVYAMGGTPITALNVAAFPKELPVEVIGEVLRGAADKCVEAGVAVLGGHTVDDPEPKFGLSVTGVVHPDRIVTNAGGTAGDVLILTKPLGLGILNSGIKKGIVTGALYDETVDLMRALNRAASEAMMEVGAHACTDITGFGLLGHLAEMCAGAGLGAEIHLAAVPVIAGVAEIRAQGATTSGPKKVFEYLGERLTLPENIDRTLREILADPQTSGGLLMAVDPTREADMHESLLRQGVSGARTIGVLVSHTGITVA